MVPNDKLNRVFIAHDYRFNKSIICQGIDDEKQCLNFLDTVILKPNREEKGYEFVGLISLEQFIK